MNIARLQLFDERGVRRKRARDDHDAGGILVEPVHDARARDFGETRIEMQQRILQRAARLAGARMDDQSDRFVDDENVGIFVADIERDGFRRHRHFLRRLRANDDFFAAVNDLSRRRDDAVEQHVAGLDPLRQPRARIVRKQLRQRLIEAPAGRFGWNLRSQRVDGRVHWLNAVWLSGGAGYGISNRISAIIAVLSVKARFCPCDCRLR